MFGQKKPSDAVVTTPVQDRPGAKNRPTPKRRDQEAARKHPIVNTDRKSAKAMSREKRREAMYLQRQAMVTGDEKHMPLRDRGPVKRFLRDSVDARWNFGEFLLPVMILVLVLTFMQQQYVWAFYAIFFSVYGLLGAAVIDNWLFWRRTKSKVLAKFGEVPRGSAIYAALRAFQMRRLRMPKPMVTRGQHPS